MAVFGSFHHCDVASGARLSLRLSWAAIGAFALVCAGIPAADAANFTCSWNNATSNWTTVADWSTCNGTFPNNVSGNTYDATISQGNPTLTTTITIGSVTITSPGAWTLTGTSTAATLTGSLSNAGTLGVDNAAPNNIGFPGDPGGSSLAIGQTLSNSGTVSIGNTGLTTATLVTATGLSNTGTINLTGSATKQAALNILGPAPATLGNVSLFGDTLLQFASGAVGGIASGTTFSLRNDPTPIVLNPGGVANATFSNAGTLGVDNAAPNNIGFPGDPGGSSLAIGQTLSNSGTVSIGNTGLTTATLVTATGLSNTGTINLTGSATKQAALNILGPAPATLGNVSLFGDTLLQLASGAVGGIASGTTFSLRNDPTPIVLNPGGVANATFSNAGTLGVDNAAPNNIGFPGDPGGSSLAIGQTLSNSGTVSIGNTGLTTATLVTATGLSNTGTINLTGSATKQAALNILGPAPATLGNVSLFGDTLLQFASGAVGGIASGTTFSLRNDPTPIVLNPGGVANATFSNAGTLGVDNAAPNNIGFPGDPGGSSLAIGQTLSNSGTVSIGNTGLTTATLVTATGLSNTGTINLTGSATKQAALNILGPAPATLGNVSLFGDTLLQFASGAVGGIASGTTFSLRNDPTPIVLNPGGVANATFSNAGTLGVDNAAPNNIGFPGDPGGSSLAIGQTLSNSGTVSIGNTGLTTATLVTTTGLSNTGTINLTGSASTLATLNILGPAGNAGAVNIAASNLTVTGMGNAYTQTAGSTNLSGGSLAAPNVNITGGTLQGLGTGNGALSIGGAGTIQAINLANSALPATLTINGNYAQSGGTFNELLHGTRTQIDVVSVGNGDSVKLTGGNLQVSGVSFALGQMFNDIMTFQPNELSGTFATLQGGGNGNMVNLGGGLTLEALYNNSAGNISLEVVGTPPNNPANPSITPTTINFGDVRINSLQQQALSVTNVAGTPPQASLDAQISAVGPATSNSGTISLLAPGGKDTTSLVAGLSTATAGAQSGTATVALQSDATPLGGGTVPLPSQNITVQGNVFGLATGSATSPANIGAARVGIGTLSGNLSVTNTAAVGFSENLDAAISAITPQVIASSGSVTGLAPGHTNSTGLSVSLDNSSAGAKSGTATVQFQSDGTGIDGGAPVNNGSQVVTVTGNVYTPAVASVLTTSPINFGIVHVGDGGGILAQSVSVQNGATATALNDGLVGTISAGGPPFSGSGSIAAPGLAPGASSSALQVNLATDTAGIFTGTANLALASHDSQLADLPLSTSPLSLQAQVNLFAALGFTQQGGQGSLSGFDLDFGDVSQGSSQEAMLAILNDNPLADQAFTDLLSTDGDGSMGPFTLTGCSVGDLSGGDSQGGCDVSFDTSSLGDFQDAFSFAVESSNSSGYDQVIDHVALTIEGDVEPVTPTPEPGTLTLLSSGLGMLFFVVRRRRRTA